MLAIEQKNLTAHPFFEQQMIWIRSRRLCCCVVLICALFIMIKTTHGADTQPPVLIPVSVDATAEKIELEARIMMDDTFVITEKQLAEIAEMKKLMDLIRIFQRKRLYLQANEEANRDEIEKLDPKIREAYDKVFNSRRSLSQGIRIDLIVRNINKSDVTIAYDSDNSASNIVVTGPGALHLPYHGGFADRMYPRTQLTIKAGASHTFTFRDLKYGTLESSRWIIEEPGDYTVSLTYSFAVGSREVFIMPKPVVFKVVKEPHAQKPHAAAAVPPKPKATANDLKPLPASEIPPRPKEPEAAAVWAAALVDVDQKHEAFCSIASDWARKDPEKAAAWAAKIEDNWTKFRALCNVVSVWAELDPVRATAIAATINDYPKVDAYRNIAAAWAKKDLEAATAWAATIEDSRAKSWALNTVAIAWLDRDLERATSLAKSITDSWAKSLALRSVARVYAKMDLETATELAKMIGDKKERIKLLESLALLWAKSDLEKSATLLSMSLSDQQFPDARTKELMIGTAAAWAKKDPKKAAAWAETISDWNTKFHVCTDSIAPVWSEQNPEETAAWATTITEKKLRTELLKNILTTWGNREPEKAAKFKDSLRQTEPAPQPMGANDF